MGLNKIIRQFHRGRGIETRFAEAVGTMNRPLRRLRCRTWYTVFNLFISIISPIGGLVNAYPDSFVYLHIRPLAG